jgi:hypothetical protein
MAEEKQVSDPYQKYKDFKWENPDEFRNGPIGDESRKCRDIICCIFFIVFLVACVVVAILGFVKGHPSYLMYAYDEDGKACGHSEGYKDYPYLYFYQVVSNVKSLNTDSVINGVCVKECPKEVLGKTQPDFTLNCHPSSKSKGCIVKAENYYQSKVVLNRICFPMNDDEIPFDPLTQRKIKIYDTETKTTFERVVQNDEIITSGTPAKEYI